MTETLELPSGEVVTPADAFEFNGYPYRFRPLETEAYAFLLSPLYWGDSAMDVPFTDRAALAEQWGDSRGVLSDGEWEAWLADARDDERFTDAELDGVAVELGLLEGSESARPHDDTPDDEPASLAARVRRVLPF